MTNELNSSVHPAVGLAFLLSQLGAHVAEGFERRLVALELTPQHVGILRLLAMPGARFTQRALADRLGMLPSRLVVLLDELQTRDLVGRETNPDDRRSNLLRLTREGAARLERVEAITAELDADLLDTLPPEDRQVLATTLARLAGELGLLPRTTSETS